MITEEFKNKIWSVINGVEREVKSDTLLSPEHVDVYLRSIGMTDRDIDTNGWQWDFWANYQYEDRDFVMAGSGWYNDGISFYENIRVVDVIIE